MNIKHAYIVTYDIADPERLTQVYKVMRGFGDHLQLSVFRCELMARQMVDLKTALLKTINVNKDQVLLVDLGPADGRGGETVTSLGRVFTKTKRQATVI